MSGPSIAAQVVALSQLNVAELRERWREIFGETTTQRHKQYMVKRLAWELQRRESGEELSPEALKRLEEIQEREFKHSDPKTWFRGARHNRPQAAAARAKRRPVTAATAPKQGAVLTRDYKGRKITVTVRGDREFEWNGEIYTSLSAAAKAITGSHCSGNAFFGLIRKAGAA